MGGNREPIAANDQEYSDDIAYYSRRELEERERAISAHDEAAREAHLFMAAAYRRRLAAASPFDVALEVVR